jgi:tRNA(Ile)-lysidine synthase
MPALAAEELDATRLGRLAERLARADKALDRAADAAFARTAAGSETGLRLDLRALRGEPEEIALRVLRRALGTDRYNVTADPSGPISASSAWRSASTLSCGRKREVSRSGAPSPAASFGSTGAVPSPSPERGCGAAAGAKW